MTGGVLAAIITVSVLLLLVLLLCCIRRRSLAARVRRRREWFVRMPEAYLVLWWVPEGHIPSTEEAVARLDHLRAHGATPHAFNFRNVFPPPDAPEGLTAAAIDDACPAT